MESTKLPWRKGPATELDSFYLKNGYFPALPPDTKEWVQAVHSFERRQCVTLTLNAAYESWCIAQIAKALNKDVDYEYFNKHAHDYQNVFNDQTGAPWKTQKRVRDIMNIWYGTGPLGICGDEDGGMMSLWYMYSAMGIYSDPYIPGYPVWHIGSPIFEKVTINLDNKKTFMIEAKNVSAQNKYIQSAMLNGKPLNKPWFEHSDLVKGGTLVLNMGPRPNKQWGSTPQAAPPSMIRN